MEHELIEAPDQIPSLISIRTRTQPAKFIPPDPPLNRQSNRPHIGHYDLVIATSSFVIKNNFTPTNSSTHHSPNSSSPAFPPHPSAPPLRAPPLLVCVHSPHLWQEIPTLFIPHSTFSIPGLPFIQKILSLSQIIADWLAKTTISPALPPESPQIHLEKRLT
jgi:hypothetical protein